MVSRNPLASRARMGLAPFAGAVLVSLTAVLCLASVVAGLGLLFEAERLWEPEYVSITDCLVSDDGQSALSLFWRQHARGPARPLRLGAHSLGLSRPGVEVLWPHIAPMCLAASPLDRRIFVATQEGAIYSAAAGQPQATPRFFAAHPARDIRALECSPDGRTLLAIGSRDALAWNVETCQPIWQRGDLAANSVSFDPSSSRIVCGLISGEVVEVDADTGQTLRSVTRMPYAVNEVRISPDGRWLACVGYERRVALLSWPRGDRVWQSNGPDNFAGSFRVVCFSPCGRWLVTAAADSVSQLTIWDVPSGRPLGMLRGHRGVVLGARFAEAGRLVSWGTDGTVRTWDVQRLAPMASVRLSASGTST